MTPGPGRAARFVRANTVPAAPPLVPEIRLHLATEITPLWQATEVELGRAGLPPPFWAFAWPGSQALARLLLDRPELARGRQVMDFAAGSGLAAIAAARAGAARITANEIDPFALAAIRLNAALNRARVGLAAGTLLTLPLTGHGLVLAGDVCYERGSAAGILAWLRRAAADGAEVLLADPGRSFAPSGGLIELARYDVPTSRELEDREQRETRVWRLLPDGG